LTFYSDISVYWLIPAFIVSVAVGYIYYSRQEVYRSANKLKRIGLVGLRSAALFLLIVLLFNILTERQVSRSEKPMFITLIDNSSSLKNYADSNKVLAQISDFQNELKSAFSDRFEIETFLLADSVSQGEVNLNGTQTNLNAGFDYLFNQFYNRNIGGIVLISDGNYNSGIDPVYSAEKIKLTPVFSLGVGDTILKRDQLIRSVNVNSVAFLDNEFPVEVTIEAKKDALKRAPRFPSAAAS